MSDIYQSPLPKDTTEAMFNDWLGVVKRHECASIIMPKWDRHYRVAQFIKEKCSELRDIDFQIMTLQSLAVEEAEKFILKLNQLKKSEFAQTVFLVMDGEWLFDLAPHLISVVQDYILASAKKVSFFIFYERNINKQENIQLLRQGLVLIQNVFQQQLYSKDDAFHFIKYIANGYGINLESSVISEIINQCGGCLWFSKEVLRNLYATGNLTYDHPGMLYRLKIIWESYSDSEKEALKTIILKRPIDNQHIEDIQYLIICGHIKKVQQNYHLTVPVLETYIKQHYKSEQTLIIRNEQLYLGQILVNEIFSDREVLIMKHFAQNQGQLVLRDKIGELLWGENWQDQYSDWGLNQAIKRLRTRLIRLGLSEQLITTIKSKGFIYSESI